MQGKWRVKKGDLVFINCGKDKGKTGEIIYVNRDTHKVTVKGINILKRHKKPSMGNPGGIIASEAPIHMSNVMHMDPSDFKPTRVGVKTLENGEKVRYAKRSGELIDK